MEVKIGNKYVLDSLTEYYKRQGAKEGDVVEAVGISGRYVAVDHPARDEPFEMFATRLRPIEVGDVLYGRDVPVGAAVKCTCGSSFCGDVRVVTGFDGSLLKFEDAPREADATDTRPSWEIVSLPSDGTVVPAVEDVPTKETFIEFLESRGIETNRACLCSPHLFNVGDEVLGWEHYDEGTRDRRNEFEKDLRALGVEESEFRAWLKARIDPRLGVEVGDVVESLRAFPGSKYRVVGAVEDDDPAFEGERMDGDGRRVFRAGDYKVVEDEDLVAGRMYPLGEFPVGTVYSMTATDPNLYKVVWQLDDTTEVTSDLWSRSIEVDSRDERCLVSLPSDSEHEGIQADADVFEQFLDADTTSLRAFLEDMGAADVEVSGYIKSTDWQTTEFSLKVKVEI